MGWIHDDENDSSGFHGGFEGGGMAAPRVLTAAEIAAAEAALRTRMAAAAAEDAAFKALPTLAAAGVKMVEDMDDDGNTKWVPAAKWRFAGSARVTEVWTGPLGKTRAKVAKVAPHGWAFAVK